VVSEPASMLFCLAISFCWFLVCIESSKYLWKIFIYLFFTHSKDTVEKPWKIDMGIFYFIFYQYSVNIGIYGLFRIAVKFDMGIFNLLFTVLPLKPTVYPKNPWTNTTGRFSAPQHWVFAASAGPLRGRRITAWERPLEAASPFTRTDGPYGPPGSWANVNPAGLSLAGS
jgi:hypothetical protein